MDRISAPIKITDLNFLVPLRKVCTQGSLFVMLLRNDLRSKFRHSILGVLWLFIPPVCILLIYVYVFSVIFKMRWQETGFTSRWGFGLVIYSGITVYSAFSDSIMGSLNVLTARAGMLKRVPFPFELLPISLVCANMLISGTVLWILFLLSLLTGGQGSWMTLLYFPLIYLPFTLLTIGGSWIVAALGVFFRDLSNLLGILLLLLFFASPVLFSSRMIPEQFAMYIQCNPLTPVIGNVRRIFLLGQAPEWTGMLWLWVSGIVVFQLGYVIFQRLRRRFADVV